jgi:hypothetical protein
MFKYVKFTKVETEYTVLEFRGQNEDVKVNHFDVDVVSVEAENQADIDALIASQPDEINCEYITHDEFKALVANSMQLERIRDRVKEKIAKKYDVADEIAMSKRDATDKKRVAYETYIAECVDYGNHLKSKIGY